MRHDSMTHRVALDWLFDRINLDPKIQVKYIDTKNQLTDILTKGNFTRDEWNHLLCLSKISTNDESYRKGAVARIILDFSKPGEEKLWKSRSLEFNC